jgi:hypothetical protein
MYGGRTGGRGAYDDYYYDDYYADDDDDYIAIEPFEGNINTFDPVTGLTSRNVMTDEYNPNGARRFRSGMPSPAGTSAGAMGGSMVGPGGVNGPRSRPIFRGGRRGPEGRRGGPGGRMPFGGGGGGDMMAYDDMMMPPPPGPYGSMDGFDYMDPPPRSGGAARGRGSRAPSRAMSRGSEPVQGTRSMSEMYVPNREQQSTGLGEQYYGGSGGDFGYDDFADEAPVVGAMGKGDRMMYRPGMDLGPVKPGMYGDDSIDDDDDDNYDDNRFQARRGGRGVAAGSGSRPSRVSNDRRTLDVEVEEAPSSRRPGRGGPEGGAKSTSARVGRVKNDVTGKKKLSSPSRDRSSSPSGIGGGRASGTDAGFDDDFDDDFEEPYFINMPSGRSSVGNSGRSPIGKKKFDERGFYYEDEDGHKTYLDVDDGEW